MNPCTVRHWPTGPGLGVMPEAGQGRIRDLGLDQNRKVVWITPPQASLNLLVEGSLA